MLFGLPMRELANRVVELEDVLGPEGARLPERLHEASGWPARFAILDQLFVDRLARARPPRPTSPGPGGACSRPTGGCG